MRIVPVDSHRILGILPAENEDGPDSIRTGVTFDRDATADLEVCPASAAKRGEMQMVCVRWQCPERFKLARAGRGPEAFQSAGLP
jgi:hypothetical protein